MPMANISTATRERIDVLRYTLLENPINLLAFGLFALFIIAAIGGPMLAPHDPLATNTAIALQPPSAKNWFGTDQLGRDIFSRVLVATRLDFFIAFAAVTLSCIIGTVIGACLGIFRRLA